MPALKNQHFVPRCLLKPFTLDRMGRSISLYSMESGTLVQSAPVKNQCSGDYFYGNDLVIERTLQALERECAAVIARVDEEGFVVDDESIRLLRAFWLVQHLRTEAASRHVMAMIHGLADLLETPHRHAFRPSLREAVQISMRAVSHAYGVADDMKVCLLRNCTAVPFVIGDDPAALANKWQDFDTRARHTAHGLKSAGAIFIMPLTPKVVFIQYDPDVYAIECRHGWVKVRAEHDVVAINQHQFLSAISNVYFTPFDLADHVVEQARFLASRRPQERVRFWYGILAETNNGTQRFDRVERPPEGPHQGMAAHESVRAKPASWPSFLRWKFRGAVYSNGSGAGYVRRLGAIEMNNQVAVARRGQPFRKLPSRA